MKRTPLILLLTLLAAFCHGQIRMTVRHAGKTIGTASITQKLLKDGSKTVQLSMQLTNEGVSVELRSESSYSAKGAPIRKFEETVIKSQSYRRQRVATFNSEGATVVEEVNGERRTTKVPLAKELPSEDLTEFWFLRDKPKQGTEATCYAFNLETMKWDTVVTQYTGDSTITIGGQKVRAHRTHSDKGTAYLDDEGLPYRLETGNGLLERVMEKPKQ